VIEVKHLFKSFGKKKAVENVSFNIQEGLVTGFVGPNGSGKTTTIRSIVNLITPTSGTISIDGQSFQSIKSPLSLVGASIDSKSFHKSRSLKNHLLSIATSAKIDQKRVDLMIQLVGLESVANKKMGTFSLGMIQRANIAVALLGDPKYLILDEPINGLDPEGVVWVRNLCRSFAENGRGVFISSHLLSELENVVDNVIIIGKGHFIAEGTLNEIKNQTGESSLENAYLKLTNQVIEYSFPNPNRTSNNQNNFANTPYSSPDNNQNNNQNNDPNNNQWNQPPQQNI